MFNKFFNKQSSANDQTPNLIWKDDQHLTINNINFHLSIDSDELRKSALMGESFLLGKPKHMVESSVELGNKQRIDKIFEMGILQGGSIVLYDQIFKPSKIAAIEHAILPVNLLAKYIDTNNRSASVKPYYGVNQADRVAMEKILTDEFPAHDIDLIVDDASHLYENTRDAFNIAFPFLKKGGLYIIEDWAWAHWTGDYWQEKNDYLHDKPALSNILIELFMLNASRPDLISEITINCSSIIIKRGDAVMPEGLFIMENHYLLRGKKFNAWL